MKSALSDLVSVLKASNKINQEDVLALRREIFPDGHVDNEEAEAIICLHRKINDTQKDHSFFSLLVEVIVDYITGSHDTPCDTVTDAEIYWLECHLAPKGIVETPAELEALICILEKTRDVPERLAGFALAQVKHGVIVGDGPTTRGRMTQGCCVDAADVEVLRRILFAVGSQGSMSITREEADILFDIHDATVGSKNDPSFEDLFVKAIANHVLAYSGVSVAPRDQSLGVDATAQESLGITSVLGEIRQNGFSGQFRKQQPTLRHIISSPSLAVDDAWQSYNKEQEEALRLSAVISPDEAAWLTTRIMRDGRPTASEQALLSYFFEESTHSSHELKSLLSSFA